MKRWEKFKPYKITFIVFFALLTLALSLGVYLFLSDFSVWRFSDICARIINYCKGSYAPTLIFEMSFFLLVFISGPTIYAPAVSFLSVFVYGVFQGFRISMGLGAPLVTLLIDILFTFCISYLLVIYSTFVTLTCLKIFRDTKDEKKEELFDGVLFRAGRFCSIFNLRYLASYVMFFTVFVLLVSVSSFLKGFLVSL